MLRMFFPDNALQSVGTAQWLVGWLGVHSARCAGRKYRLVSVVVVTLVSQSEGKFTARRAGCMPRTCSSCCAE